MLPWRRHRRTTSRDRYDVPNGDFSRSLHQGNVMMSGLAKLRAEWERTS